MRNRPFPGPIHNNEATAAEVAAPVVVAPAVAEPTVATEPEFVTADGEPFPAMLTETEAVVGKGSRKK